MEILSVIAALESLNDERCDVVVFSDSRYVVDAYTSRKAHQWKKQNWMRNKRDAAKNPDLWARLIEITKKHNVTMEWVEGHSGHPENERCDELAVEARTRDDLPEDEGYLKPFEPSDMSQTLLELF